MKKLTRLAMLPSLAWAMCLSVGTAAADDAAIGLIKQKLGALQQQMPVESIQASEQVKGLYEVRLSTGETFFATPNGRYLVVGDLYEVAEQGVLNLSEQARDQARIQAVQAIDPSTQILFSPSAPVKASVYVFTDVDCPYCQKLHQEVPKLTAAGVEVRYLAFPRTGPQSATYQKMQQVWCAQDKAQALTQVKQGQSLETPPCDSQALPTQYALGQSVGVRGTPSIVLPDGRMIPGYVQAEQLITALGLSLETAN
ncbi:thiol:disulfide interchange protein DsbC [Allopseudospirillum japonicum]|uniref:Thiol:disulfide interchange protein n=1 Tax=Allopseudospirillum japonicum TaxID=64971 RepID=A0A1H6TDA9_9GAMM|nr:DsbC family protein [Allopseudospirillum japonicum]SEI78069.1 thiol:disulfide interchange protein DsbC [Allopseudospirillum japonicum]